MEEEVAGHVVGHGQRRPVPGKLAALRHWEKHQTISELRSFMGFCKYYSGYVRMYADLSGPVHKMLQVSKFDGRKGSNEKLAQTTEAEEAFDKLKERLLGQLGLLLVDRDKGFVPRTDASICAMGVVLEQVWCDRTHIPVAFGVESRRKANVGRGPRGRRRLMPLCARSRNYRATSDFNRLCYVPIINHFRVGTRSIWILPRVQRQGEPDGTRPLRSST